MGELPEGTKTLADILYEQVVSDYYTPNIKAEVILDTLLTPFAAPFLEDQLGDELHGRLVFLTKEASIFEEDRKNDQGHKIDYLLEDEETVYLAELKTSVGYLDQKQADRYRKYCRGKNFGEALGDKLLKILRVRYGLPEENDTLEKVYSAVFRKYGKTPDKNRTRAENARELLGMERDPSLPNRDLLTGTGKYLHTAGQLLDHRLADSDAALWKKPLRLIYLTPDGRLPHPSFDVLDGFCLHPAGRGSAGLDCLAVFLRKRYEGDAYAGLLADIITRLCGENGGHLVIHRGSHQVGGCCTEIGVGWNRVLIDFGANLPGTDETAPIKDRELPGKVFGVRRNDAVLFTHYHADHFGLYKSIPSGVPMYIGPIAKNILRILTPYIDRENGLSVVEGMGTYEAGSWLTPVPGIEVLPLYVDHSALDAYMFCIRAAGKTILFTGDFREHGIMGQKNRLARVLKEKIPGPVDVLVTEATMLNRREEAEKSLIRTERELGKKAGELFRKHKYHFVLVSSTNLDSIMEFYHNTPRGMHFVCDFYQAKIMITAMRDMEARGDFPEYQPSKGHPVVRVLGDGDSRWAELREIGQAMKRPLYFRAARYDELERDGFVLLARKNAHPEEYTSPFDDLMERFFDRDGQIIYSMWQGYLEGPRADKALISYIGGRPYELLHTSGHAYVETIAGLMRTVDPKTVIPMHTDCAGAFSSVPEFAPWADRVRTVSDGEILNLNAL